MNSESKSWKAKDDDAGASTPGLQSPDIDHRQPRRNVQGVHEGHIWEATFPCFLAVHFPVIAIAVPVIFCERRARNTRRRQDAHDDQADSTSQALAWTKQGPSHWGFVNIIARNMKGPKPGAQRRSCGSRRRPA